MNVVRLGTTSGVGGVRADGGGAFAVGWGVGFGFCTAGDRMGVGGG